MALGKSTHRPMVFFGNAAAADKAGTVFIETVLRGKRQLCSGSFVGRDRFLTAAHCVADNFRDMKVGLGPLEIPATTLQVVSATKKPGYDLAPRGNDLAVLTVEPNKMCGFYTPLAVLKAASLMLSNPPKLTVVGYGLTQAATHGKRLEANVPVASLTCYQTWTIGPGCRQFDELILSSTLRPSAGVMRGTDTCEGDSGGPAFMYKQGSLGEDEPFLAAVTSRGIQVSAASPCGAGGIYEIAGTADNLKWLRQVVPDLTTD